MRCSRLALCGSHRFRPDMGCVLYRWDLPYPTVAIMIFRIRVPGVLLFRRGWKRKGGNLAASTFSRHNLSLPAKERG